MSLSHAGSDPSFSSPSVIDPGSGAAQLQWESVTRQVLSIPQCDCVRERVKAAQKAQFLVQLFIASNYCLRNVLDGMNLQGQRTTPPPDEVWDLSPRKTPRGAMRGWGR